MDYTKIVIRNTNAKLKKYLIVLPAFPNSKGFCHQTILVREENEYKAKKLARYLKPHSNIGEVVEIFY